MHPLEKIFQRVSKEAKDGKKYLLFKELNDLVFLYATGFVDTKKYTLKQWVDAFESSKQKDGSYLVSKDQWLDKKKYHYEGPVPPPWDPMTLEEKEYSEKEMFQLLKEKILPCTLFDPAYATTYINNLKTSNRLVGGKIKIDKEVKEGILNILNQYPSPMRVLQTSVHGMLKQKRGEAKTSQDQLQKSAFAAGQTAQQIVGSRLSDLTQKGAKETKTPLAEKPAVSLKDMQKRRITPGRV